MTAEPGPAPASESGPPTDHHESRLLVVLHGHDSSPENAADLARQVDPGGRFAHVAPEGPYESAGGGREWFSDTAGSLAHTQVVLGALFAELSTTSPLVVVGYSQGAAAALATLTSPGAPAVKAVACVSGYLGEEPGLDHDLGRLAGTAVLVQHGRDDEVVPDFLARDLVNALETAGVAVTAQWFEMGHERTIESLAALTEWLAQQEGP